MCSHQPKFTTSISHRWLRNSQTIQSKLHEHFDVWQSLIWYALWRVNKIKRPQRETVWERDRRWQRQNFGTNAVCAGRAHKWHIKFQLDGISPLHRLVSVLFGVFVHATICRLMSNKHFNFIFSFLLAFFVVVVAVGAVGAQIQRSESRLKCFERGWVNGMVVFAVWIDGNRFHVNEIWNEYETASVVDSRRFFFLLLSRICRREIEVEYVILLDKLKSRPFTIPI